MVRRIRRTPACRSRWGLAFRGRSTSPKLALYADAAVVGSALVSLIAEASGSPRLIERVESYVRELKSACVATTDIALMTLDDLRRDIDRVDEVLVRLLNERARCVCEIGRLKKEQGIAIYQPDREKDVLRHVREVAVEGPLGPDAIGRLFERIIDEARTLERRVVHDEVARWTGPRARSTGCSRVNGTLEATEAMVVVMEERATEAQIENVVKRLVEMGMDVHRSTGVTRTVLGRGRPGAA